MATRLEKTFSVAAPIDKVSAAMRSFEQIKEAELARDALSVKIEEITKSDTRHEYEIKVVSHARTVTGIDKSKTESSTTRVKWDLSRRAGEWVWTGEHKMVKLNGSYTLREEGAGTSVKLSADISVGIPIAGRVVEKKVAAGFEEEWPSYIARVLRYAQAT